MKIFDAETGALVRVLSSSARGEVTQLALASDTLLLVFSVDGCIALWEWRTGSSVRIYRTRLPIHAAVVKVEGDSVTAFVVSHRLRGVSSGPTLPDPKRLFNYCAPKMISLICRISFSLSNSGFKLSQLFKARGLSRLALSPCGGELAFSSRAEIKLWRLDDQEQSSVRTLQHSNIISRLMYHPREPCLVLADVMGRVVMWYCLNVVDDQEMPQRTLHWHANEVTDLAFCNEGQYLLSGGEESVMVLWQIESGLRQYLPRLGDPIHFICVSPDDRIAAISTRDNCIHFVSLVQGSSLQVQCSVKGVAKTGRLLGNVCSFAAAGKPALLLPGTPGKVQLFDPLKDVVCGGFELAPQNRKSTFVSTAPDKHRPLEVALTAVSSCGRWMVSLEQRRGKDAKAAALTARLKFWSLEAAEGEATLLTIVDRPHRDLVTDLTIWVSPAGMPMAASSSFDGTFKIWGIDSKHGIWSCQHVGSYHEIGLGCLSVSVSPDASLLATTFGPSVTLWSLLPGTFGHLADVLTPSQGCLLKEARFVGLNGLIASCREMGIFAFNRLAAEPDSHFQLSWHAPVIPRAPISVHPELAQFAMVCTNPQNEDMRSTCVLTYSIESPLPVGYHFALNAAAADFVAVSYIPSPDAIRVHRNGEAEKYLLAILDAFGEFTLLGTESASRINRKDFIHRIKPARLERIEASKSKTKALYAAIFDGAHQPIVKADVKHSMAELFAAVSQVPKEEVLLPLVASHVLPPMNMLFAHYIKNTVKKLD